MRSLFLLFILAVFGLTTISSCKKGDLPKEYYFGKIEVSLVALPNTPDIEVRFDGKKLREEPMLPGATANFQVLSQEGKLEIFKANTDTLLADTLISIPPNTGRKFRFAYSEEFGLQGFVAGGNVPADSVRLQFINSFGAYYDAYPSLDLHIGYRDIVNGGYAETGIVIKDFNKKGLHAQTGMVAIAWPDGTPYRYYARLKNNATGEFIVTPGRSIDWFIITAFDAGGVTNVLRFSNETAETGTDGRALVEIIQI
ncbi:MAG TPA: hypothetical protein VGE90_05025 [Chitinophaga sp.]